MKHLALLTFLCLSLFSFAGKPYRIDVTVYDIDGGAPLPETHVVFKDEDDKTIYSTLTDKNGKASFNECKEKIVEIMVFHTAGDYETKKQSFYKKYDLGEEQIFYLLDIVKEKKLIAAKTENTPIDSTIIVNLEACGENTIEPEFPGGISELRKYLMRNIKYPEMALDAGIGGKCYLLFFVDPNGEVSHIVIERGIPECPECDQEVIRIAAHFPNWTPGSCNGKNMGFYYHLPIAFNPG